MNKIITVLCILSFLLSNAQNIVPPVKRSNGKMKITPDPNRNGGKGNTLNSSGTVSSTGNKNAITVIVDHSGSMTGAPLNAANNSSLIMVDLIDLWGEKLFPKQLGKINFQYIEFGGAGEYNVLHSLGRIKNSKSLRTKIISSNTKFGGTDFSSGIEPALSQLKGKKLNNKTIFLTDAGDQGNGSSSIQGYYNDLVDTKFIIYNAPGASVSAKGWLKALPNGSEFHVDSEYEVLSLFVKTLFEFVDDINEYLVRQGSQRVDINKPFNFFKHTNDKEHLLILSKPKVSNLEVEKIVGPSGNSIPQTKYSLYSTQTFFNIILKDSLPSGEYKVFFKNANRSNDLFYINFEKCNIYLNLDTSPKVSQGSCFIENSAVNFNFKYWDMNNDTEILYPDFLSHSAYHYKIANNVFDKTGKATVGLSFSHSFPIGSAGSYEVWTAWSYNEEKMRIHDSPPLSLIANFCITKQGVLVQLDYDDSQTWEGRQIVFKAKILNVNQAIINNVKKLYLNTGHEVIELEQDSMQKNAYEGILDYVKGGRQYSLTLENRNNTYAFAFDKNSKTSFLGKKRQLQVTYIGKDYDAYKQKNTTSFLDKVKYIFSSKEIPVKKYTFKGHDIRIPYQLPYYKYVKDSVTFVFTLNKVFSNEQVVLNFESDSLTYTYPKNKVAKNGLWGIFSTLSNYQDAVSVNLSLADSIKLNDDEANLTATIIKKKGEIYIEKPLYVAPKFIANGNIEFSIDNGKRIIPLDTTNIQLDIVTSPINKFYVLTKWTVYWTLSLILTLLLLLVYFVLYVRAKTKCNQKVKLWRRLNNSDLSLIEDLWSEPSKHHKCNTKLELPAALKNAFIYENNLPSKQVLIKWVKSDESENIKEIKKRFCYLSLFYKGSVPVKILYLLVLPIAILIDLSRNAFEMDSSIIKNKVFLDYVRCVENASIPNIPSEWNFSNTNRALITFNTSDSNAIRLRHISYHSKIAEVVMVESYISILALNASLNVINSQGATEFLTIGKRFTSRKYIDEVKFIVNDEIEFIVENIDYETSSFSIKTHLINH
jgi:hypothetical protein